jgi:pimeloyl-ACP methyl ester carboxylesterase
MSPDDRWLLLHGTPLTPAVWAGVASLLRPAGSVQCPSVVPKAEGVAVQHALAVQVLEPLSGAGGGFHVVGHSFGGQVAIDIALHAPRQVRSLTVMCSRDTPFPPFAAAATALRRGDPIDLDTALGRWFRPDELDADGPVVRYARRCLRDVDRSRWATAQAAIADNDRSTRVAAIDVPVTLIAAELDQVSTPAAMADLAHRVRSARLHVLADAAHMTPFTAPARLAELLLAAARP